MAEPVPKVFEYATTYDGRATFGADGTTLTVPDAWSPEHLVLAGLLDCSLTSLRYHAKKEGIQVEGAGEATSTVTRREEDGRFAFVEIEVRLDVSFDPPPADVDALLRKAERDCFVGASLNAGPRYVWNVA